MKLALLSAARMPRPPEMLRMPFTLPPPKGTTTFDVTRTRLPSMNQLTPACAIHSTGTSLIQQASTKASTAGAT